MTARSAKPITHSSIHHTLPCLTVPPILLRLRCHGNAQPPPPGASPTTDWVDRRYGAFSS